MSQQKRQFSFNKYKQRHIALKILYFGWDYDGIADQDDNKNTVEFHLFEALMKTCLIENKTSCSYNRCGRTDKGVSSYGQVVNLNVKSNLINEKDSKNIGLFTPKGYTGLSCGEDDMKQRVEFNYVLMLNRVLPENVIVIAWTPVDKNFSSRFSCQRRSYSYMFPLGNLCLKSMKTALDLLVGEHDFRNFCSYDLKNGVFNHERTIVSVAINPIISKSDGEHLIINPYSFYEVEIVGQAFLYHQIRCIMTVIFLVGSGKESPSVVENLLDINMCSSKPHYNYASSMPLCLTSCDFRQADLPLGWIFNQQALCNIVRQLKRLWLQYKTKALMIERVLLNLELESVQNEQIEVCYNQDKSVKRIKLESNSWTEFGLECDNMSDAKYQPLLKRARGETLEKMIKSLEHKKKESRSTSNTT